MYPSIITVIPIVNPTDRLNSPSHSGLHNTTSSAVGQIQAFVGLVGSSSAVGTLAYDVRSPNSDGGGHVQSAVKGGTGQTTFAKGDLLVAQNSTTISKLSAGANDAVLIADSAVATGVKWGAAPTISVSSTTAISSVWTKPLAATATSKVFVQIWGGGGSGAGGNGTAEVGGGGGGGYAEAWFLASILTSSVIVQVGKGGDSISNAAGGVGQIGAITVFDVQSSLLTAYAGGGGGTGASGAAGGGGGGTLESGTTGSGTTPGIGGAILSSNVKGDDGSFTIIFDNGVNAGSIVGTTIAAPMGGGGGFGGNGGTNPTSMMGGRATYGGGGGAGITSSVVSGSVLGGRSAIGGRGGMSSIITTGSVTGGSIPGGGGGGGYGSAGSSGEGGKGMAIITTFL